MPQSLLKTPPDAGVALQVNGRSLGASHEQIAGILRSRLGQNHGDLLAMPRVGLDGSIDWLTPLVGAVVPAVQLPGDERLKLEQRALRFQNEIRGLAQQMRGEGPAALLVAQLLEQSLQTPPGAWLYSVGGKPVLAMWGHAAAGTAPVAAAAVAAPAAPLIADAAAEPPSPPPALPPGTPPPPPSAGGWKRWLLRALLALLLLALLLWGLKRCSDERQAAEGALAEQIAQAEARNKALEDALARGGPQTPMQCVPDAPPPAAPPAPAPGPAASAPPPAPPASTPPPAKPPASAPPPKPPAPLRAPPPASAPAAAPASAPAPRNDAAPRPTACKPRGAGDEPELILIIDASGSMREPFAGSPSRLDAAKGAAGAMVRALPAEVDVGLVDFSACGQVRRDKFYAAPQRGALLGEIGALSPKQGTPLADALRRAGSIAADSADSTIVVVSDGGDSCGGDPCAVARSIRAAKPNVSINVIDLSTKPADRAALQCIAGAGGGRLLSPGDTLDMNRKMREAAGAANCPP